MLMECETHEHAGGRHFFSDLMKALYCPPKGKKSEVDTHQVVEVLQYERLALEAGLVKDVSKHSKHLLHQHDVVRLVELVAKLRLLEGVQHLKEKVQPHFRNVALRVPECPDDGVRRHHKEPVSATRRMHGMHSGRECWEPCMIGQLQGFRIDSPGQTLSKQEVM